MRVERRKDEGGEGAHRKKDDEEIDEVPMEPVERLSMVLRLNGLAEDTIRRVVSMFKLNPSWWGDPYRVDAWLTVHVHRKKEVVASLTDQYWSGVQCLSRSSASTSAARLSRFPLTGGGVGGGGVYQYGYAPYGGRASTEVEQLRAEVAGLKQDRMNDMIRQPDESHPHGRHRAGVGG